MNTAGEDPDPETVATPFAGPESTLHDNEPEAVSISVAFNSGATQELALFSTMVTSKGPAPCVMTGASFTPETIAVTNAVVLVPPSPSVREKETMRFVSSGLSKSSFR